MMVCAVGLIAALAGSLWSSMGEGALGVAFGSGTGMFVAATSLFGQAEKLTKWDKEAEASKAETTLTTSTV